MSSTVQRLHSQGLIRPPAFLPTNTHYEVLMGSVAFGVSNASSDWDIYGFAIPPREVLFPHLAGEIPGFGTPRPRFDQFQITGVVSPHELSGQGRVYDLTIYNIVKYFQLCLENNPNLIDSLFAPQTCVLHCTTIGQMIREKRTQFLHKGCWPKFKGYAYRQLHKMRSQKPIGKRKALREQFGFDVKFAYHLVRLLLEVEQLLNEHDVDLQRHREHLKAIRRGDVSEDEIRAWAADKERHLEAAFARSTLPELPPEAAIRTLLLECLEAHYGRLDECVIEPDAAVRALREVQAVLERNRRAWDVSATNPNLPGPREEDEPGPG